MVISDLSIPVERERERERERGRDGATKSMGVVTANPDYRPGIMLTKTWLRHLLNFHSIPFHASPCGTTRERGSGMGSVFAFSVNLDPWFLGNHIHRSNVMVFLKK